MSLDEKASRFRTVCELINTCLVLDAASDNFLFHGFGLCNLIQSARRLRLGVHYDLSSVSTEVGPRTTVRVKLFLRRWVRRETT
jgi:hypothetical protein